ncbi:glycosyltransferase family 2 protein [Mycolicibacterium fortuitum]|uniref:glycosyltransferase family 2 protein n=1 Tax=Mycolicibacterium fortuitum TaxID=1766 RepID=UPI00262EA249|nr:glycosyltransferase [Mycolicibacterium fortuitum]
MINAIINGERYVPAAQAEATLPRVGIAITTKDRNDTYLDCLAKVIERTPAAFPIIVVDDGSTKPAYVEGWKGIPRGRRVKVIRHETSQGIPAAKNASLAALMDAGVDHLFLLDNDCYPLTDDWWRPFVESPEPHLSAQFLNPVDRELNDITILYADDQHEAWSGQRGYCLYYHRDAIERVGGFDPIYSPGLYEHSDLANRIFENGLTTWRYASPRDSHLLVESLDRTNHVERTPLPGRQQLVQRNAKIHNERRDAGHAEHVPYRQPRNVVLTCLYTGNVDPQRGTKMAADPAALDTLTQSARPHPVVVLHDELDAADHDNVTYVQAANTANVYFQRWINAHQYLTGPGRNIDNVLICDGTDVEILRPADLFTIPPGRLLVGSEHQVVGCDWMRKNHPDERVQQFINDHADRQLLNAGVLAGARALVVDIVRDIIHAWADIETRQFHRTSKGNGIGDMGVFNMVLYTRHRDRIIHGPHVTTMFKANERNAFSLIRHK